MFTLIDVRGSGKTKKLLEAARENNALILTQDKRALQVKAKSYNINNINIIDYSDLENDNYSLTQPLLIHDANYALTYLLDRYYGLNVLGYSGTLEDNKNDSKK